MPGSVILAFIAGAMLPLQAAVNAQLGRMLGSSIWATAVSGAVMTAALVIVGLIGTETLPRIGEPWAFPWWAWTGGLFGCFALAATTAVAPRLGVATMFAIVIAGQVACSLTLDHFGLFGLPFHPLTSRRVLAAILLVVGGILIR